MDKIEKSLVEKQDERNNYYTGLATRGAFITTLIVALLMNVYFIYRFFQGDNSAFDQIVLIMFPINMGMIVFVSLLVKWKVSKK